MGDQDKCDRRGKETRKLRTVDEPEKCTSSKTAGKEGQEGEDENGGPNRNTATEVSAVAHRVVVETR